MKHLTIIFSIIFCTSAYAVDIYSALETEFDIQEGVVSVFDTDKCDDPNSDLMQTFNSCFGNNPTSPYILFHYPANEQEYVDPYFGDTFKLLNTDGVESRAIKRLALSEATVSIINMPPEATYFSYLSYLMTRDEWYYFIRGILTRGTSPNPDRQLIFASTGDATNHKHMELSNNDQQVWGEQVIVISASSPEVAALIEQKLRDESPTPLLILTEQLDKKHQVGLHESADDFLTLARYAIPLDEASAVNWLDNIDQYISTYRVNLSANTALTQFDEQQYDPKTGNSEAFLTATKYKLETILTNKLRSYFPFSWITRRKLTPSLRYSFDQPSGLHGDECRQNGILCIGDNQDTDSYRTLYIDNFTKDTTLIFVGGHHVAMENASYVNLSLYNARNFKGIEGNTKFFSAYDFVSEIGSLGYFNKSEKEDLKLLSVVAIGGEKCTQKFGDLCWVLPQDQIVDGKTYGFIHRAYLNPNALNGANPDLLVDAVLITSK